MKGMIFLSELLISPPIINDFAEYINNHWALLKQYDEYTIYNQWLDQTKLKSFVTSEIADYLIVLVTDYKSLTCILD